MKPIEDQGHLAQATKPLKPKYYDEGRLPDPVQCAGCIIGVVNRHDHNRLSVRISDGSSWLTLDVAGVAQPVAVQQDITPLVRAAVEGMLPALVSQPVKVIEHAPQRLIPSGDELAQLRDDMRCLAQSNLEISDVLNPIAEQLAEVMARLEFVERHALAGAEIKAA